MILLPENLSWEGWKNVDNLALHKGGGSRSKEQIFDCKKQNQTKPNLMVAI